LAKENTKGLQELSIYADQSLFEPEEKRKYSQQLANSTLGKGMSHTTKHTLERIRDKTPEIS